MFCDGSAFLENFSCLMVLYYFVFLCLGCLAAQRPWQAHSVALGVGILQDAEVGEVYPCVLENHSDSIYVNIPCCFLVLLPRVL